MAKAKSTVQSTQEVKIECKTKEMVKMEDLVDLQGNLKELPSENYKKMSKEILTYGFIEPVSVWLEEKTGKGSKKGS